MLTYVGCWAHVKLALYRVCDGQYDCELRDALSSEMTSLLSTVDNPSMKEVKGLEDRLSGLEQLMHSASRIVDEQREMAQVCSLNISITLGTDLIHDFTAVTFSAKLAFSREKRLFPWNPRFFGEF